MMKRMPFVFAAALLMAALLYQPIAAAQGGADSVDASIDAILNSSAPVPQPASAPARAVAAAKDVAAAVEARAVEAETAVAPVAAVQEAVEAPVETPAAASVVEVVEAAPAPAVEAPAPAPAPAVEAPAPEPTAEAPAPVKNEGGQIMVSMQFEDVPLPEVIRSFRDATGANIISGWTNATTRLVNMSLDKVEWRMGLNALVASYGLELKEEPRDSAIYVVREKVNVESEKPRYVETFELKHSKAEDVARILGYSFGLTAYLVPTTNQSEKAKSTFMPDPKSVTIPYSAGNLVIVKGTEEQLKDCRSIIDKLDVPKRQVYIEARFVRLNSSASKQLGMKWDSLDDWGITLNNVEGTFEYSEGSVRASDGATSYSASGREAELDRSKNEAIRNYTSSSSRNVDSGYTTTFTGLLSVEKARLALSAFERMDGVQMFSNPKIIVENETTARIDMTTKEPNIEIDYQASTQAGQRDSISSKLVTIPGKKESWVGEAFFSYGITLDVTPRVSPSGLITVDIVPSISSLDDNRVIPLGEGAANYYPIIKMQRLETRFTLGDGKTAVIGGLTQTSEGNIDSGIPLLRSIPWIGPRLFGWKSRQKIQDEIIIFVTVGIVDGETIEQNVGMPKNAVLGRGLLNGTLKEPGDRTDEEMFNLESKSKGFRLK